MNNISVFCFMECEHRILLVKKSYGNLSWTFPGGAIMPQEDILGALKREVREETGQHIADPEFIASFYSKDHYSIALCFAIRIERLGQLTFNAHEISEAGLFDMDDLPSPMSPRYVFWLRSYQDIKMRRTTKRLFQYA